MPLGIKPNNVRQIVSNFLKKPDIVGLFLVCMVCVFAETIAVPFLRYDIQGIEHGQYWRLLTGHIVHLGWEHTLLNLSGLLILAYGFDFETSVKGRMAFMAFSALLISAGMWCFYPTIHWYVGLSGVLHGYIICLCAMNYPKQRLQSLILAGALTVKVLYEQFEPAMTQQSEALIGGRVVTESHLLGWLSGLLFVLYRYTLQRIKRV